MSKVLGWEEFLNERTIRKKEGDESLSNTDYAYVPDPSKTSTWKLRIDDDQHIKAAAAAFSPGGHRGNKVQIPKEDYETVRRRVIKAYKKSFGKYPPWSSEEKE